MGKASDISSIFEYHVTMTQRGLGRLALIGEGHALELCPGEDYTVRQPEAEEDWLAFPDRADTAQWRHSWVMRRLPCPVVPVFSGCPMPKAHAGAEEKNAMLVLAYFHPWTLIEEDHCEHVPFVGQLKQGSDSFLGARQEWQRRGVPCEEAARYIRNFLNMVRTRASGSGGPHEDNSDDLLSDVEVTVTKESLPDTLATKVGGHVAASEWGRSMGGGLCYRVGGGRYTLHASPRSRGLGQNRRWWH